jgi:hypothetical protein
MSEPSRRELLNIVYKLDLYSFLQCAFGVLEPGNRFMPAAYLELLCAARMQVDARAVKRLIINTPPRHLKSFVTSVVFPAWLLMRDPKTKIAVICHSDMLANDLASKCKRLIESDEYRQIAPQVQIRQDRDRRMDFETTRGGGVYFASIASGITGRGFDHIILDDPIAANDAQSAAERDRVQQAFDDMISSRLDEPARGTITVVQQRLHEADLFGIFSVERRVGHSLPAAGRRGGGDVQIWELRVAAAGWRRIAARAFPRGGNPENSRQQWRNDIRDAIPAKSDIDPW